MELESLRQGYLDRLEEVLVTLREERRRFHEENSEEILRLALALGEKLARATLPGNDEALRAKLEECLRRLDTKSAFEIRVNDRERDLLSALMDQAGREMPSEIPYRIVGDARIEPGDLVLEAQEGRLESICSEELTRLGDILIRNGREGEADLEQPLD